jgi:hypothetical protein
LHLIDQREKSSGSSRKLREGSRIYGNTIALLAIRDEVGSQTTSKKLGMPPFRYSRTKTAAKDIDVDFACGRYGISWFVMCFYWLLSIIAG